MQVRGTNLYTFGVEGCKIWDPGFGIQVERAFFIENLLVRIHSIIEMIWWTGLTPWEFEFPFPDSLISTFLGIRVFTDAPDSVDPEGVEGVVKAGKYPNPRSRIPGPGSWIPRPQKFTGLYREPASST